MGFAGALAFSTEHFKVMGCWHTTADSPLPAFFGVFG